MLSPSAELRLQICDVLLSSIVVAPLVVAYWRGTWQLVDTYLPPYVGEFGSALISLSFGCFLHLLFALFRPGQMGGGGSAGGGGGGENGDCFTLPWFPFLVLSRSYTALFGLACVNAWRGVWKALDHLIGDPSAAADASTFAAAVVILVLTRTLRNISAPPFVVIVDSPKGYFHFHTFFRTDAAVSGRHDGDVSNSSSSFRRRSGHSPYHPSRGLLCWSAIAYLLDCFLSVVIIGSLVVVVWRGSWCLIDHFLFPERADWSAWSSLGLGYLFVVLVFSLQTQVQYWCTRIGRGFWRLVIADFYIFLSFLGTVNVWRGIWNLFNVYFLTEAPALSNWLTHLVPLLGLMLLGCSNSILVRGIFIDGEESGGDCVIFPVMFIRHYSKRMIEENHRVVNLEEELKSMQAKEAAIHPLMQSNHHSCSTQHEVKMINKGDDAALMLEEGRVTASDAT